MLVIDASAAIELLLGTQLGVSVNTFLAEEAHTLHAPDLLGVEITSVLRRLLRIGDIDLKAARQVLADLEALGVESYEHAPLLPRVLALRNSLTACDACYVALAEGLGAELLTCDAKLAAAHGHRARVRLIELSTA